MCPKANHRSVIIPKGTIDPQDTNIIEIPMNLDDKKMTLVAKSATQWNPKESHTVIARAAKDMLLSECASTTMGTESDEVSREKEPAPPRAAPPAPPPRTALQIGECGASAAATSSKPMEKTSRTCGTTCDRKEREYHPFRHHHTNRSKSSPKYSCQTQTNTDVLKSISSSSMTSEPPHSPYCPICSASSKIFRDSQFATSSLPAPAPPMTCLLPTTSYLPQKTQFGTCPLISMGRGALQNFSQSPTPSYGGSPDLCPVLSRRPLTPPPLCYHISPSCYSRGPQSGIDPSSTDKHQNIDRIIGEKIDNIFKPLLRTLAETRNDYCYSSNNSNRSPGSSGPGGGAKRRSSGGGALGLKRESSDVLNTAFITDDEMSSDDDLDYDTFKNRLGKTSSSSMACTNNKCDRKDNSGVKFTK